MSHTGDNPKKMNVIEAYSKFIETSPKGRTCTYALKCKSLFMMQDYKEVKKLLEEVLEHMEEIENSNL
jgi:hypothetical protein